MLAAIEKVTWTVEGEDRLEQLLKAYKLKNG